MDRQEIILKALKRSYGSTMEDVARTIDQYLDIAGDIGGVVDTTPKQRQPLIIAPTKEPPRSKVIEFPSRGSASRKPDATYRTVDQITRDLSTYAPPTLSVQPPGFKFPIKLMRQIEAPPSPELGFVKLVYVTQRGEDGPAVLFNTTDPEINIEQAIEEIKTAAMARYSPERRTVAPRDTPVPQGHIEAEADEAQGVDQLTRQSFDRSSVYDNYGKAN